MSQARRFAQNCRVRLAWLIKHLIQSVSRQEISSKFCKIRGKLSQDSAVRPGRPRLRNNFSKSKHSLASCFGKLIEARMHVFWSWREGFLTFQHRFQTAGYLACVKSCPWVTPYYSRNFFKCRDSVDSALCPRNHNRSAAKPVLFSWSLGYSKWR